MVLDHLKAAGLILSWQKLKLEAAKQREFLNFL
jgi:hypothetical protein